MVPPAWSPLRVPVATAVLGRMDPAVMGPAEPALAGNDGLDSMSEGKLGLARAEVRRD